MLWSFFVKLVLVSLRSDLKSVLTAVVDKGDWSLGQTKRKPGSFIVGGQL